MPKPTKALLIVPANNTTMEPEIAALCPELDTILVARVRRPMRTLTADDMAKIDELYSDNFGIEEEPPKFKGTMELSKETAAA